jgi:hypothetical protein
MSDEIYEHLPKWRRVLRDLAKEAGIKGFTDSLDEDNKDPVRGFSSPKQDSAKAKR